MKGYDWLIVGGGPHGRFIAAAIRAAAPETHLAIVDAKPALAAWHTRATACGMRYLRSSNAHHLGQRADSLRRFAAAHGYDASHSLGYYRRPSLALFNAHAADALGTPTHIQATACALRQQAPGWRVRLDDGRQIDAARVVLATGPAAPYRPAGLEAAEHVFDPDFALGAPGPATIVVGGGITGAQLVLRGLETGHRIGWLTRRAPTPAHFDSDPCYAGPRCLVPFANAPIATRTELLAAARLPGTLPPDIHGAIAAALARRALAWWQGEPTRLDKQGLTLADGRQLPAERVILATGFNTRPAPDSLLGRAITTLGLTTDGAGHVHINADLEAAPGLHIAGRPASLQLGPMAGNIKGARLAGRILAGVARHSTPVTKATATPIHQPVH